MFANREKSSALNNFVVPSEPESRTLGIIQEFRQLYEDKMKIIDSTEGNGDCNLQAKLALQNDWIRDLNEQNEMLVRAVEELEQEATERVMALEEKLRQSAKCACELKDEMQDKQMTIKVLESKLDESLNRECQRCATLKQSMMDMRDALTAEVADKHDAILALKRDVSNLEEQCRKADQQTHFKDDIIKELRKEIKTLKLENLILRDATTQVTGFQNSNGLIDRLHDVCANLSRRFEEPHRVSTVSEILLTKTIRTYPTRTRSSSSQTITETYFKKESLDACVQCLGYLDEEPQKEQSCTPKYTVQKFAKYKKRQNINYCDLYGDCRFHRIKHLNVVEPKSDIKICDGSFIDTDPCKDMVRLNDILGDEVPKFLITSRCPKKQKCACKEDICSNLDKGKHLEVEPVCVERRKETPKQKRKCSMIPVWCKKRSKKKPCKCEVDEKKIQMLSVDPKKCPCDILKDDVEDVEVPPDFLRMFNLDHLATQGEIDTCSPSLEDQIISNSDYIAWTNNKNPSETSQKSESVKDVHTYQAFMDSNNLPHNKSVFDGVSADFLELCKRNKEVFKKYCWNPNWINTDSNKNITPKNSKEIFNFLNDCHNLLNEHTMSDQSKSDFNNDQHCFHVNIPTNLSSISTPKYPDSEKMSLKSSTFSLISNRSKSKFSKGGTTNKVILKKYCKKNSTKTKKLKDPNSLAIQCNFQTPQKDQSLTTIDSTISEISCVKKDQQTGTENMFELVRSIQNLCTHIQEKHHIPNKVNSVILLRDVKSYTNFGDSVYESCLSDNNTEDTKIADSSTNYSFYSSPISHHSQTAKESECSNETTQGLWTRPPTPIPPMSRKDVLTNMQTNFVHRSNSEFKKVLLDSVAKSFKSQECGVLDLVSREMQTKKVSFKVSSTILDDERFHPKRYNLEDKSETLILPKNLSTKSMGSQTAANTRPSVQNPRPTSPEQPKIGVQTIDWDEVAFLCEIQQRKKENKLHVDKEQMKSYMASLEDYLVKNFEQLITHCHHVCRDRPRNERIGLLEKELRTLVFPGVLDQVENMIEDFNRQLSKRRFGKFDEITKVTAEIRYMTFRFLNRVERITLQLMEAEVDERVSKGLSTKIFQYVARAIKLMILNFKYASNDLIILNVHKSVLYQGLEGPSSLNIYDFTDDYVHAMQDNDNDRNIGSKTKNDQNNP